MFFVMKNLEALFFATLFCFLTMWRIVNNLIQRNWKMMQKICICFEKYCINVRNWITKYKKFAFNYNINHIESWHKISKNFYEKFASILKYFAQMCKTVMSDAKYLCRNTIKLQSNIQPNFGEILLQKHCILVVKICISKEFFDSVGKASF